MLLLDNLYYVVNRHLVDDEQWRLMIKFNTSHPVFDGHFPDHPIVPGACLVQIAQELTSVLRQEPIRFAKISNLKFRQPIVPSMEVVFVIQDTHYKIVDKTFTETYAQFKATYMCSHPDL